MNPWCATALLAVTMLARPAVAQTAEQTLSDLDRFRSALGTHLSANLVVDDGTPETLRAALSPDRVELRDLVGNSISIDPADTHQTAAMRLLAAVLSTGPVSDRFADLGVALGPQLLSYEVFESSDGPVLVRRVGTAAASVLVEHGTARPRSWRVELGGTVWQADVVSYGELASGWIAQEIVLRNDGRIAATVRTIDAAPDAASLTPLQTDAETQRRPPLRIPRLPL